MNTLSVILYFLLFRSGERKPDGLYRLCDNPQLATNSHMVSTTITLTRHDEPNRLIVGTLKALALQENVSAVILFFDQRPDAETASLCQSLDSENIRFNYRPLEPCGISRARNTAIAACKTETLLFIDADAIPDPGWAASLAEALLPDNVGIAGGRILPEWHKPPLLITKARTVREQYSMLDYGDDMLQVPRVVGASFGIHLERLGQEARFDEDLGRRNGLLLGGEESDLCTRARDAGLQILYQGKAVVHHQVLPERIRYRWIFRRLFYAGVNRALRGGMPSPSHRMTLWDYIFMPLVMIPYALGYRKGLQLRRQP